MSFKYYNANPLGRNVNDCTVRAFSLATGKSWDEAYEELSHFAQKQCIMPDEVEYIDEFLRKRFEKICGCRGEEITVDDFVKTHPYGIYLITMKGHITCCINGCIYDTFNPSDNYIWDVYKIKGRT